MDRKPSEDVLEFLTHILPNKLVNKDVPMPSNSQMVSMNWDDGRSWRPLRTVSDLSLMPHSTLNLLLTLRTFDWKVSIKQYFEFLLHVTLVECGFIPCELKSTNTTPENSSFNLKDFIRLPLKERMDKCFHELLYFAKSTGSITSVKHYFILEPSDLSLDNYTIGDSTVNAVLTERDTGSLLLCGVCGRFGMVTPIQIDKYLLNKNGYKYKVSDEVPIHDVLEVVNHCAFMFEIKHEFCLPIIDKNGAMEANAEGIRTLPKEILERIAQYLDCKSFAKLVQTSRFINKTLDTDLMWNIMCDKAPKNFLEYGDRILSDIRKRHPNKTGKELFKACLDSRIRGSLGNSYGRLHRL